VIGRGKFRIFHGLEAELGQFPFVASLSSCTGSILNSRTILTAAHCVCEKQPREVEVGMVKQDTENPYKQRVAVKEVFIHPNYKSRCPKSSPSDMAILKLSQDIQFNDYVKPISVNCDQSELPLYADIVNMGYGVDEDDNIGTLKYAFNKLMQCRLMLCSETKTNAIYYGDSGGPCVWKMSNGTLIQVGVNSAIGRDYPIGAYKPNQGVGLAVFSHYSATADSCQFIKEFS
jgi:secreted trypsin-like serine protease